ncbi:TPA: hypothetical protein U5Y85_001156 [Streptococcus agalactiae]|nr:hypothetical protein [Streptococcus agalactiae]HEN4338382.1 hypothetical protein [Streptococcus agalactiae]
MIEKFSEIKNADIFIIKSYLREPGFGNVVENFAYILTWTFVDLPFFLLDLVVGIFLVLMKVFENTDILKMYEQSIYKMTKSVWQNFSGGNGIQSGSLLWFLLAFTSFYLFFAYLFNHGQFINKVKHTLIVLTLLLSYFGVISGTGGGLYVFQTIRDTAQESVEFVSSMDFKLGKETVKFENNFSDTYLRDTVYASYLYVNSGSIDGSYSSKDGKKVYIDNSKLLGKEGKEGKFKAVSNEDRRNYLKDIGKDEIGQNVFLAPTLSKVFLKAIFVIIMIFKAIILAVPILFIYFLKFMADLTFLIFMVGFPFCAILSFIPSLQNIIFRVFKIMFITDIMPFFGGLLLIIISLVNKMITTAVVSKVDSVLNGNKVFESLSPVIALTIFVIVSGGVYYVFWKYKESLMIFLLGSGTSQIINQSMEKVTDKVDNLGITPNGFYDKISDMSIMPFHEFKTPENAQDNWNNFQEDRVNEVIEEIPEMEQVGEKIPNFIDQEEVLDYETSGEENISDYSTSSIYDNVHVREVPEDIDSFEQILNNEREGLNPDFNVNTVEVENDSDIPLKNPEEFRSNQEFTEESEKYQSPLLNQNKTVVNLEGKKKQQEFEYQTKILEELEKLRKK